LTLIFPISDPVVSASQYAEFWRAIATEDERVFLKNSEMGAFETCLPEWQRMRGEHNTQHATHEFTLDVHTAKVLTKTRQSQYFQTLPPEWQELTTLAALLHDIDKEGGLAENRFKLKPDMAHPAKAVATVRKRLPTWDFSQQAVEWASLLVGHHQAFGRWIMRAEFLKTEPSSAEIHQLADTLRSATLLQALQALTEGDIRGVKDKDALFTPFAEERLATYATRVHQAVLPIEAEHSNRLNGLLTQLNPSVADKTESAGWLFSEVMKPESDIIPTSNLLPETIIATLPLSFLADVDASQCSDCDLKNQSSNRVFSVELQPFKAITQPYLRVGVLGNQLMGFDGVHLPINLQVQNPVMLGVLNAT